MLRFRVGPIPVLVHFSHVLISGLLAWSFAQNARGHDWPGDILANTSHPANRQTFLLVTLLWVAIISVSVLIHELGHALASRLFGYNAVIQLVGMGGLTQTLPKNPGEPVELPWHHELVIVLAGPLSGLSFGLFAGLLLLVGHLVGHLPVSVIYVLNGIFVANLFWALLNLMPVAPLDGGALSRVLLMRVFGRRGFLFAQVLTLVVALGAVVAAAFVLEAPIMAFLFSLYGFRAISLINAYRRGEAPVGPAAHPATATLAEAEAFASSGKLDDAERVAQGLVAAQVPASLTARAHAVLGWVQVKRGHGREALTHFELADPSTVPAHALAAAHSLSGDEVAALPLWERAATSGDAVIRHEWAGALIRAGREFDARKLPEIRMSLAFAAAERVHFLRREYTQAAHMAEASFREEPSSTAAYDAACAWALANEVTQAMRCLTLASQNGFKDADTASHDPDLKSLRGTLEFENWLASL